MKTVVDIGNTNVKIGWLSSDLKLSRTASFAVDDFVEHLPDIFDTTVTKIAIGVSGKNTVADCIVAHFKGSATILLPVSASSSMPFEIEYARGQAGIDRLANVAAALNEGYAPAVIVDAGSAITVEVISDRKVFKGGAILPGLRLQALALQQGTAALPAILEIANTPAIGTDTKTAIQAGLVHGTAGAVEHLITRSLVELGNDGTCPLIFTGGDGALMAGLVQLHDIISDPTLTLRGIAYLAAHQFPGQF